MSVRDHELEHQWGREFARATREYDRIATRELKPMSAYVGGRWSSTRPAREGVYLVRTTRCTPPHSWVTYLDVGPHSTFTAPAELEYFHLEGDVDGAPTRWDDERVAQVAHANGWREPPTHTDGRARRTSG